jgi:predicted transcriptional regulator
MEPIPHLPTFDEIEAARKAESISISRLCRTARLGESGYFKLRHGSHVPKRETRKRLAEALVQIKREDGVDLGTRSA